MQGTTDPKIPDWHGDRDYLLVLARLNIPSWLRPKVDASDVVQIALKNAVTHFDQFRGDGVVARRAWLRRILVNAVRDAIRRFGGKVALEQSIQVGLDESSGRLDALLTANVASPGEEAERLEDLRRLTEAIQKLPEDQCVAVELKHLHGWTVKQIADQLGRSTEAVGGLLRRGMRSLRDQLVVDSGGGNEKG